MEMFQKKYEPYKFIWLRWFPKSTDPLGCILSFVIFYLLIFQESDHQKSNSPSSWSKIGGAFEMEGGSGWDQRSTRSTWLRSHQNLLRSFSPLHRRSGQPSLWLWGWVIQMCGQICESNLGYSVSLWYIKSIADSSRTFHSYHAKQFNLWSRSGPEQIPCWLIIH